MGKFACRVVILCAFCATSNVGVVHIRKCTETFVYKLLH